MIRRRDYYFGSRLLNQRRNKQPDAGCENRAGRYPSDGVHPASIYPPSHDLAVVGDPHDKQHEEGS